MIHARILRALVLSGAAAVTPLVSGCIVDVPPPVEAEGYAPVYYEGNLVYYDDDGLPYYYDGMTVVYVPRTYVHYGVLIHHHQVHAASYRRWYVHGGYRSKGYVRHPAAPRVHRR
ncbi:MAG: hypothetical protein U0359_05215 [Byssovorax sp.]